ncbi:MAG: hypothetical protein AB1758_01445 [Candidatus Eremiobacterota bacterium]
MEWIRLYAFPTALVLAAAYLVRAEFLQVARERTPGRPNWIRFGRRMTGSVVMVAIAVMVHMGRLVPATADRAEAWHLVQHWTWVMGLVMLAMGLAVWDAVEGVRNLRRYFEAIEREEISHIREHVSRRACEAEGEGH